MSGDADNIIIGANGSVHVAPVGTALPATIGAALNVAFLDLGFMSEDGVTITDSKSVESVKVWQSLYAVRRFITEKDFALAFVMREWNKISIPLAFGGGSIAETPANSNSFKYTPPAPEDIDERAAVIKWVDGDYNFALVTPRVMVSENVETNIVRTGASDLPLTLMALGQDGTAPWYMLSDHPAWDPA